MEARNDNNMWYQSPRFNDQGYCGQSREEQKRQRVERFRNPNRNRNDQGLEEDCIVRLNKTRNRLDSIVDTKQTRNEESKNTQTEEMLETRVYVQAANRKKNETDFNGQFDGSDSAVKTVIKADYVVRGTDRGSGNTKWYVNSQISKHMTPKSDIFASMKKLFSFNNEEEDIKPLTVCGIGDFDFETEETIYTIPYVSYVPEINISVLSLKQLILQGFEIDVCGKQCKLSHMCDNRMIKRTAGMKSSKKRKVGDTSTGKKGVYPTTLLHPQGLLRMELKDCGWLLSEAERNQEEIGDTTGKGQELNVNQTENRQERINGTGYDQEREADVTGSDLATESSKNRNHEKDKDRMEVYGLNAAQADIEEHLVEVRRGINKAEIYPIVLSDDDSVEGTEEADD